MYLLFSPPHLLSPSSSLHIPPYTTSTSLSYSLLTNLDGPECYLMHLKGPQSWDNFEFFFFTKIKSLYSLGKFSKKISLLFLRFLPEFRSSNIFAETEHTRNQIFFKRYPKFFFSKCSLGSYPIRWVTKRFFKIWILYSRNLHFNVGFLNNFRKL